MNLRRRPAGVAALTTLLLASSLSAHDFWIAPSTFEPSANGLVSLRLLVGQKFRGEPLPRTPALIEKFVLVTASGEAPIEGRSGGDPAGLVRAGAPGLAIVEYRSRNSFVELDADKFEKYLKDEGLDSAAALRHQRGENARPARDAFARCAKALLSVGGGGAAGSDRALGMTLELVAQRSPYAPAAGDLPLLLLYQGKPLAGALVVAFPYDAPDDAQSVRTDKLGRAGVRISRKGVWLVKAVHMVPATTPEADWQSLWASLTFDAPGPGPVGSTP